MCGTTMLPRIVILDFSTVPCAEESHWCIWGFLLPLIHSFCDISFSCWVLNRWFRWPCQRLEFLLIDVDSMWLIKIGMQCQMKQKYPSGLTWKPNLKEVEILPGQQEEHPLSRDLSSELEIDTIYTFETMATVRQFSHDQIFICFLMTILRKARVRQSSFHSQWPTWSWGCAWMPPAKRTGL